MCWKRNTASRGFSPRRFAVSTEVRLVAGFFVLLYVVGGGLIWLFYGIGGAFFGLSCTTGGLFLFLLLYGLVWLLGKWAGD